MNKFYFFLFFFSLKFLASEELLEKEFIEGLVEKKNKEEKKQFLLPQSENLILEPEQTLKEISTHFTPKTIKKYRPLIQKIQFLGVDFHDLIWNCWYLGHKLAKKDINYFYQVNIDLIGIYWRYGIFCGVDGGFSWIKNNSSGFFLNISLGWEYFGKGFCKISFGGAKKNNTYPIWWMITPISKTFKIYEINNSWNLILRIELLFKRLISPDILNIKTNFANRNNDFVAIPFFGKFVSKNIKNTYFGLRFFLEILYKPKEKQIVF